MSIRHLFIVIVRHRTMLIEWRRHFEGTTPQRSVVKSGRAVLWPTVAGLGNLRANLYKAEKDPEQIRRSSPHCALLFIQMREPHTLLGIKISNALPESIVALAMQAWVQGDPDTVRFSL